MNLWFRLVLALLRIRFGRPRAITETGTVRFRVWPTDLDVNAHMNNGRYATLMDLGRVDLMGRAGKLGAIRAARIYPVVTAQHILYRRSLAPFERFRLITRVIGSDERHAYMEQRFVRRRNGADELAARGIVQALFLRDAGGRVPMEEVRALFELDDAMPVPGEIGAMFPPA